MLAENEKYNISRSDKHIPKKNYLNKNNYPLSNRMNEKKSSHRNHSYVISNQKKSRKPFGTSALENARKALEQIRDKREIELFSMLQHRIKDEYLKYKTFTKYNTKQKRLDKFHNRLDENKKANLLERQMEENERLQTHYDLNEYQNKLRNDKIHRYKLMNKQKENRMKSKDDERNEELRQKKLDSDARMQETQYRFYNINEEDKIRRYSLDKKMREKDRYRKNMLGLIKESKEENSKMNSFHRKSEHEHRLKLIKDYDIEKNKEYIKKSKDKEKYLKLFQNQKQEKYEEKRQMLQEKEYNIRMNLNNCEIAENLFRKKVQQKILDREISTKKLQDKFKSKWEVKIGENHQQEQDMEYRINQMKLDDNLKREKKRKELLMKNQQIDKFLKNMHSISEEKRFVNDNFSNKYNSYSNQITNLLYKRPMDRTALNNVQDIVSDNPNLAGVVQQVKDEDIKNNNIMIS